MEAKIGAPGRETLNRAPRRQRLSPEEYTEAAGEFAWPETEDGEWDFLRPGREPGELRRGEARVQDLWRHYERRFPIW